MSKNSKVTILYSRLSCEDSRQDESLSIENQKKILEDYAVRNGFTPFLHLSDDGFSGTQWNRPGWQELIAKVEADEVLAVVIKDSSRMGRDYLRVGLYRDAYVKHKLKKYSLNFVNIYESLSGKIKSYNSMVEMKIFILPYYWGASRKTICASF